MARLLALCVLVLLLLATGCGRSDIDPEAAKAAADALTDPNNPLNNPALR